MDKIKANLLKAIEGKTSAWQRLSIDDILKLSAAYKNIYNAEMIKQDIECVDYDSEVKEVKEPEIDGFFFRFLRLRDELCRFVKSKAVTGTEQKARYTRAKQKPKSKVEQSGRHRIGGFQSERRIF